MQRKANTCSGIMNKMLDKITARKTANNSFQNVSRCTYLGSDTNKSKLDAA
jgi:hypothetical protein